MRVAYFSPLPPSTSGIADYSALLVPALERLVDVEVVRPGRTRPVAGADVALYHVGNDPDAHAWIDDVAKICLASPSATRSKSSTLRRNARSSADSEN